MPAPFARHARLVLLIFGLGITLTACIPGLFAPAAGSGEPTISFFPNTPGPTPTITPTASVTPPPASIFTPTALIELVIPTATNLGDIATLPPGVGVTLTPTLNLPTVPAGGILGIDDIRFVRAQRLNPDSSAAIVTLSVEFFGGTPPFTVINDQMTIAQTNPMGFFERNNRSLMWIEFNLTGVCNGRLIHTLTLTSADTQRTSREYFIDPTPCDP